MNDNVDGALSQEYRLKTIFKIEQKLLEDNKVAQSAYNKAQLNVILWDSIEILLSGLCVILSIGSSLTQVYAIVSRVLSSIAALFNGVILVTTHFHRKARKQQKYWIDQIALIQATTGLLTRKISRILEDDTIEIIELEEVQNIYDTYIQHQQHKKTETTKIEASRKPIL